MNLKDIEFIYLHKGLIIVLLSITFFFSIFLFHRLQKKKLFFSFLRLLIFLLLIFLLFKPEYNIREKLAGKPVLAILLDNSSSMDLADPEPRWQKIKNFFSQEPFKKLGKKYEIKYYTFSDKLSPWGEKFPQPVGKITNYSQALKEIGKVENLAGIFLISDGQNNQGEHPLVYIENFNRPIYALGVGNPQPKDLAIEQIKSSDFAFKNIPIEIEVEITGYGFEGKNIPLNLSRKNGPQILDTENVKIDSQGKGRVKLNFTPQELGEKVYLVSVPTYKDEISVTNNSKEFLLNVVREKIRILYLCGQVNYEYAFIRNVLKNDPSIELVSFVILRNPENIAFVPDDQLSLIPFPAHEIFVKELHNYDLVIIENFTYHRFGILSQYLDNLYRFVTEEGGGLVMIGGDNAFGRGGYKGTAIEDLLPVEIYNPHEEKIILGFFQMWGENYQHPIMNLGATMSETMRIWQEMPELDSCNQLGKAKPGATVLGFHPQEEVITSKVPILAVWDRGKGRVLVFASNTTWRWALGLAKEGKSPEIYADFWRRVVRWLTRAEEMKLIRIVLGKKSFLEDEKIPIEIRIYDKNYQLLKKTKVRFHLFDWKKKKIDLSEKLQILPEGGYWAEITPDEPGEYTLFVEAWDKNIYLGEGKISFQVLSVGEKEHFFLNEELLRNIAKISGGEYFHLEEFDLEKLKLPEREILGRVKKKIVLWNQPYLYFLIGSFLVMEWYFRRESGLL